MTIEASVEGSIKARSVYVASLLNLVRELKGAQDAVNAALLNQDAVGLQTIVDDMEFLGEFPQLRSPTVSLIQILHESVLLLKENLLTKSDAQKHFTKALSPQFNAVINAIKLLAKGA